MFDIGEFGFNGRKIGFFREQLLLDFRKRILFRNPQFFFRRLAGDPFHFFSQSAGFLVGRFPGMAIGSGRFIVGAFRFQIGECLAVQIRQLGLHLVIQIGGRFQLLELRLNELLGDFGKRTCFLAGLRRIGAVHADCKQQQKAQKQ